MTLFSKPPTVDNIFLFAKQDPGAEKTGNLNSKHQACYDNTAGD